MNLRIEPVDAANREAVLSLRPATGQEGFVETVAECLAEARSQSAWRPVAILCGEEVVGFAMYGFFAGYAPAGRVWMDRLLIGDKHQGKGYGRAAMRLLIERLAQEYGRGEVYLSVVEGNAAALALYASLGFAPNGERDVHGEKVMVLIPQ